MEKNTSITIRMDRKVKEDAQTLFNALGMDLSTAVNIFLKRAIRERGLPFDVNLSEPNEATLKALADASSGIEIHGPFDSIDALMEDLDASD